jgi:hypothetical protein
VDLRVKNQIDFAVASFKAQSGVTDNALHARRGVQLIIS